MSVIDAYCDAMQQCGASDLFLHEGYVPQVRLHGAIVPLESPPLSVEEMGRLWEVCAAEEGAMDKDVTYTTPDGTRFRVNLFRNLSRRGAVFRIVQTRIPGLESLGLPHDALREWVSHKAGLILISGPTGSGKSTTLASLLDWVNQNQAKHIVSIEDPIEFVFSPQQAIFSQREVGLDVPSYTFGLKQSLRQSPDIIMLGEIRDRDTAITALQAAETGHMVLSTLHGATGPDTVDRFIRLFPEAERESNRMILSVVLRGILCQRLLRDEDNRMICATEHFENQGLSRKMIAENRIPELADYLLRGDGNAVCSFVQSLVRLCKAGVISADTARQQLPNPQDFNRAMSGISSGTSR
jgi:pilus retraction protein PilT